MSEIAPQKTVTILCYTWVFQVPALLDKCSQHFTPKLPIGQIVGYMCGIDNMSWTTRLSLLYVRAQRGKLRELFINYATRMVMMAAVERGHKLYTYSGDVRGPAD